MHAWMGLFSKIFLEISTSVSFWKLTGRGHSTNKSRRVFFSRKTIFDSKDIYKKKWLFKEWLKPSISQNWETWFCEQNMDEGKGREEKGRGSTWIELYSKLGQSQVTIWAQRGTRSSVENLQQRIPGAGAKSHAVFSDPEAADAVLVVAERVCRSKR